MALRRLTSGSSVRLPRPLASRVLARRESATPGQRLLLTTGTVLPLRKNPEQGLLVNPTERSRHRQRTATGKGGLALPDHQVPRH